MKTLYHEEDAKSFPLALGICDERNDELQKKAQEICMKITTGSITKSQSLMEMWDVSTREEEALFLAYQISHAVSKMTDSLAMLSKLMGK